jgi:hypothetical protein
LCATDICLTPFTMRLLRWGKMPGVYGQMRRPASVETPIFSLKME